MFIRISRLSIAAAAARHAGRVNFGPTARRPAYSFRYVLSGFFNLNLSCACVACVDQAAGTRVCCPLCQTPVIVSATGLVGPGSRFAGKLVKTRRILGDAAHSSRTGCEACDDGGRDHRQTCKSGGETLASKSSTRSLSTR